MQSVLHLKEKERLSQYGHFHKQNGFSWKLVSLVIIAILYGTSLVLSQVNSLYINHNNAIQNRYTRLNGNSNLVASNNKKSLSFSDIRAGLFVPESKSIQWIQTPSSLTNDSGDFIVVENGNYILKSLKNENSSSVLFDLGENIEYKNQTFSIESITFSNNLKIALLTCNKIHNWRHSYFATYFIYNVDTENIIPLIDEISNDVALSIISPDSKKIAYVLENNVFIKNIENFFNSDTIQVTFDGNAQIFNGKPDWVYEEEVFESDSALWWSPDSQHLVILHSNDTNVPTFPIPYFVQNINKTESYPELTEIKYPKAGYPNPIVDILIYDCEESLLKKLPNSDSFYNDKEIDNIDRLITEVLWVGNEQVLIKVTNRESDILKVYIVSCTSNKQLSSIVSRFEDGRGNKSWFEISHNTIHIPKSDKRLNDGYIDLVDVDGFDHLAYFSPANSSVPKVYLTNGEWEVVEGAAAFDYVNDKVYYVSTEKSSIERHLYSINLEATLKNNITEIDNESWYDVSFSKGARYLLLSYQGPNIPYQKVIDLYENTSKGFTDNTNLEKIVEEYNIPETRYGNVTIDENVVLNYKETLPLNFDSNKKYPLLFFVYGGPGSQLVNKVFSVSFSSAIASELNAVVVTVDGRGTGFKGKKFRNIVRDHLGHYEVLDQVSAAKHWISKGYIDETRTAIWGWSYGGYMTLKTLSHDAGETFKYGMSVAPVTNWKFYDSVYTERYLHTPQQNEEGYFQSSVNKIDGFKNCTRFLLMHGTGDDNVHFQNSMQFVDQLDLNGVENYDMYVFPDSDHSIRWHNAGTIVYDRLFVWLKRAFDKEFENIYKMGSDNGGNQVDYEQFINLYG